MGCLQNLRAREMTTRSKVGLKRIKYTFSVMGKLGIYIGTKHNNNNTSPCNWNLYISKIKDQWEALAGAVIQLQYRIY